MNRICLVGRMMYDPEIKFNPTGSVVASGKLSVYRGNGKKTEQGYPESDIFQVQIWGKRGEAFNEHVKKGNCISVTGRMESRQHEGKVYWTVNADNWEFEGPPKRESEDI